MRISDWSSDVCSSDLRYAALARDGPPWSLEEVRSARRRAASIRHRDGLELALGRRTVAAERIVVLEQLDVAQAEPEPLAALVVHPGIRAQRDEAPAAGVRLALVVAVLRPVGRRVGERWGSKCRSQWCQTS